MAILITDNLDMRYMGLPKWPQMIVRGQPVTLDQAKEIIRRTDRAFTSHLSGNDHKTVRNIAQRLGLPASMYSAYDGQPVDEKAERDWRAAEFRPFLRAYGSSKVLGAVGARANQVLREELTTEGFPYDPAPFLALRAVAFLRDDGTVSFGLTAKEE